MAEDKGESAKVLRDGREKGYGGNPLVPVHPLCVGAEIVFFVDAGRRSCWRRKDGSVRPDHIWHAGDYYGPLHVEQEGVVTDVIENTTGNEMYKWGYCVRRTDGVVTGCRAFQVLRFVKEEPVSKFSAEEIVGMFRR